MVALSQRHSMNIVCTWHEYGSVFMLYLEVCRILDFEVGEGIR